jgi:hypothetical protein
MLRPADPSQTMDDSPRRKAWRVPVALLLLSALLTWIAWYAPWNRRATTVRVDIDGPSLAGPTVAAPPSPSPTASPQPAAAAKSPTQAP